MEALGARLAPLLRAGDLVVLDGALGAGKTTLTRGLGAALGARGPITSPTFVLARDASDRVRAARSCTSTPTGSRRHRARRPRHRLRPLDRRGRVGRRHARRRGRVVARGRRSSGRPGGDPLDGRLAAPTCTDHRHRRRAGPALDAARAPRAVGWIACCSPSTPRPAPASPSSTATRRARRGERRRHPRPRRGDRHADPDGARRRRRHARRLSGVVAGMGPARSPACGSASPPRARSRSAAASRSSRSSPRRGRVRPHRARPSSSPTPAAARSPGPRYDVDARAAGTTGGPAPRAPRRPGNRRRRLRTGSTASTPPRSAPASLGLVAERLSPPAAPSPPTSRSTCARPTSRCPAARSG